MKRILIAVLCMTICFAGLLTGASAAGGTGVVMAPVSSEASPYGLDGLVQKVDELVKRVESTQPAGTNEEKREQFFALDREIDAMDREIDGLDDKLEQDYLAGLLAWEDYRDLEHQLDKLEKRLDRAEHRLERKFGIND